ncbi:hypothetical protein [Streptomyces sp. AA1529]|uniref:hypothetical protein n=1 Tax=Streptomyces sp. AA1529 TaxID=1203257 RepID=UPI0002DE3FEE|nr:hypothetical protein [Streptomyces sp. AA1529]
MPSYTINYLTGDTETIQADRVEEEGPQYTAYLGADGDGSVIVSHIPAANVRSIHHQDAKAVNG